MNKFRYDAFLEEFWFMRFILIDRLKDKYTHEKITSMAVKRVDENFLLRIPHYLDHIATIHKEKLFVIVPDQPQENQLHEVTLQASDLCENITGYSIIKHLEGYENASHLIHVIFDTHGEDRKVNITIYKPSKKTSLADEIKKVKQMALDQVRAEADF